MPRGDGTAAFLSTIASFQPIHGAHALLKACEEGGNILAMRQSPEGQGSL